MQRRERFRLLCCNFAVQVVFAFIVQYNERNKSMDMARRTAGCHILDKIKVRNSVKSAIIVAWIFRICF